MKVFLIFSACVAFVTGSIVPPFVPYEEGQRYFFMADGNDRIHLVDREEKMEIEPRFDAFTDTLLKLYTRNNPNTPDIIRNGDLTQFYESNLDVSKPVKIVIHGWNSDWESAVNGEVTDAFLKTMDVNVIFVDWSAGGGTILYPLAVGRVPNVGRFVAYLIDWLVVNGASLDDMHVLGHSLGGHVAGIAGRNVKSGVLPYITAFDPALPMWGPDSERVRKTDGEYVEVIHTNGDYLGIMDDIGHNDFYPNGGKGQPGCLVNVACSHSRSYKFFADSLDHEGFMASQCDSVKDAYNGNCNGPKIHMGGSKPKPAMGIFYLKTNSKQPYYQG